MSRGHRCFRTSYSTLNSQSPRPKNYLVHNAAIDKPWYFLQDILLSEKSKWRTYIAKTTPALGSWKDWMKACKPECLLPGRHFHDMMMDWVVTNDRMDSSNVPVPFDFYDHFTVRNRCSKTRGWTMMLWYNTKYILVFITGSWDKISKLALAIFSMIVVRGTPFVIQNKPPFNHTWVFADEVTLRGWGLVARGSNYVVTGLEPWASPPTRGAGLQIKFNHK